MSPHGERLLTRYLLITLLGALSLAIAPISLNAQTLGSLEQTAGAVDPHARLTVNPLSLNGGSTLTIISPESWQKLGTVVQRSIESTHRRLTSLLGPVPPFVTSVRLLDHETFERSTGAPAWTNALYYRGQILIPLGAEQMQDHEGLTRAVRHEYTHAVIHALSGGKAPGWLDEGLAQWIEGSENPALKPALYSWLSENAPVPMRSMQGGFTRLPNDMVAPAYAQSLFSTTVVLNTFGFERVRTFFDDLRQGESQDSALLNAFEVTPDELELRLARTLERWRTAQAKTGKATLRHAAASVRGN